MINMNILSKFTRRFLEAVQGKELERIFKEEGVIDDEDDDSEMIDDSKDLLKANQDDQEGIHNEGIHNKMSKKKKKKFF